MSRLMTICGGRAVSCRYAKIAATQKIWRESKHEICKRQKKELAAQRFSRAVPHLSTNPALSRLTSEFGWDPVHLA